MSVARITMVDYLSEEVGDAFEVQAKEIFPKDMHQADSLILIRTGPLSGMSVAIYKDQEIADNNLDVRKKMSAGFTNTFKETWKIALCYQQAILKMFTAGVWNIIPTAWFCYKYVPSDESELRAVLLSELKKGAKAMNGRFIVITKGINSGIAISLNFSVHLQNLAYINHSDLSLFF